MRARLRLPVAALALLLGAAPVRAEEREAPERPAAIARASIGLDGRIRPGRWAVAVAEVVSTGKRSFAGELAVVTGGILPGAFVEPVRLAPGARKRLAVPFLPLGSGVVRLELRQGREVVHAPELEVRPTRPETVLVVVLGRVPSGLRALTLAAKDPRVAVASLDPRRAPEDPLAYQAADLVVWPEPRLDLLSPAARAALATYVGSGGRLLVTLGPFAGEARGQPLDQLLPATVDGTSPADASLLPGALSGPGTVELARATLRPAVDLIVRAGSQPLVVHGAAGLGEVTLVTAGAATLERAAGKAPSVWRTLIGAVPHRETPELGLRSGVTFAHRTLPRTERRRREGARRLASELEKRLHIPPVALGGVLGVLFVYLLVIGPLDYLVLRRLGRLEWTWVTFPAAVLVFAGGITAWGLVGRGQRTLAEGIELQDLVAAGGTWRVTRHLALFTPSKALRRLERRQGPAVITPSPLGASRTTAARLDRAVPGAAVSHALLATHANAIGFVEARWARPLEPALQGVGAGARVRVGRDHLEVESQLPFDLEEAVLVLPGQVGVPLGRLGAGQRQRVSATDRSPRASELATLSLSEPFFAVHLREPVPRRYLLVGTRPAAAAEPLHLDGKPVGAQLTLVRVPARVEEDL